MFLIGEKISERFVPLCRRASAELMRLFQANQESGESTLLAGAAASSTSPSLSPSTRPCSDSSYTASRPGTLPLSSELRGFSVCTGASYLHWCRRAPPLLWCLARLNSTRELSLRNRFQSPAVSSSPPSVRVVLRPCSHLSRGSRPWCWTTAGRESSGTHRMPSSVCPSMASENTTEGSYIWAWKLSS